MIRCRECNGVISESNDDFVLAEQVAAVAAPANRCAKCGTALESPGADCPTCAGAMLDDLLNATPEGAGNVPPRLQGGMRSGSGFESRLRDYVPPPMPPVESEEPGKEARRPSSSEAPPRGKGKGKRRGAPVRGAKSEADDEAGTDALYESETDVRANRSSTTVPEIERPSDAGARGDDSDSAAIPEEAASAACKSLLAALATPDADALCQVVVALGKLGDKSAQGPLERLMINPEIRVRRAAAEALIALGHPKGKSLLDIAERKVAALPASAASGYSKAKAKKSSAPIDWGAMMKPALAVVGVAIIGGGVWWWQSQPSTPRVAKKVSSAKAAAQARMKASSGQSKPAVAPTAPTGPSAFDN